MANGQVPQRWSSGKLRNHWLPNYQDLVVCKYDGEDNDDVDDDDEDVDDDDEETTSLVVWQKTKTRPIEKSKVAITCIIIMIMIMIKIMITITIIIVIMIMIMMVIVIRGAPVTKSAVFLNIVQNALDPPPPPFVLNIGEQIFLMDFLESA